MAKNLGRMIVALYSDDGGLTFSQSISAVSKESTDTDLCKEKSYSHTFSAGDTAALKTALQNVATTIKSSEGIV